MNTPKISIEFAAAICFFVFSIPAHAKLHYFYCHTRSATATIAYNGTSRIFTIDIPTKGGTEDMSVYWDKIPRVTEDFRVAVVAQQSDKFGESGGNTGCIDKDTREDAEQELDREIRGAKERGETAVSIHWPPVLKY